MPEKTVTVSAPDAVLFPMGWVPPGGLNPEHTRAVGLLEYFENLMGVEHVVIRPAPGAGENLNLAAPHDPGNPNAHETVDFGKGHPTLAGTPRYDWVDAPGGARYGTLKAEAKPAPAKAPEATDHAG